jgi:periplasmic divalent cation tolerance protein
MPEHLWIVTTTLETIEEAETLSKAIVADSLAACVQTERIISHYRWKDACQKSSEVRLTMKVDLQRKDNLIAWIRNHHPYEVPEILAWEVESANPDYSAWARNS